MRTLGILLFALFLTSCAGPSSAPPAAAQVVVVPEDIHFTLHFPGTTAVLDVFISAGRYVRTNEDERVIYYTAEGGRVSKVPLGEPVKLVSGGVAYLKRNGTYFIWKTTPSYTVRYPINGIADDFYDAPDVPAFLARFPENALRGLRFE